MNTKKSLLSIVGLSLIAFQTVSFADAVADYNAMVGSTTCATAAGTCTLTTPTNPPIYYKATVDSSVSFVNSLIIIPRGGKNFSFSSTSAMFKNLQSIGNTLGSYTWAGAENFFQDGGSQIEVNFGDSMASSGVTINYNGSKYSMDSFYVIFDSNDIKNGATINFKATFSMGFGGLDETVSCSLKLTSSLVEQEVGQKVTGSAPVGGQFVKGQVRKVDITLTTVASSF